MTDQRPLLKECATTKPCARCTRSTCGEYRLPERAASSGAPKRALFSRPRLEFLLELTGELDESRRQADIFVERVALIVARNDLRTSLIRHGGRNFVETGMQQVGNDRFERLPRKQFTQGMQSRGIIQLQAYRVLLRGSHRGRLFFPTIEQGLEFHDYSAIPVQRMWAL